MESPVRICLGAALVVSLLLLSSTTALGVGGALDVTSTTRDDRAPRYARVNNTTWVTRGKPRTPDLALNELTKDSVSEEHTEKNAKYKDRGRMRFGSQSSTAQPRRKVRVSSSTTEGPKLMIVTPEPEKKNLTQIIDSMRTYKKTKMPVLAATSTTPVTVLKKETSSHEEYQDDDEEEENENFEKYTSNKFHENSNFFTIPGFGDDDDDSLKEGTENKVHKDFSVPSYEKFSTFYPKEISYSPNSNDEPYKSDSFFHNFDSELTTPKNDFFDKKFKEISSSIIKNLDSIKTKAPAHNKTNGHKILKENIDVEKFNKGTPTNKSTVIIKNTKEVRLLDNEGAGTDNQELSDVHGTSIYYEMSVLSTETYAIDNSNEDDCENDTLPIEHTTSTSEIEESVIVKASAPIVLTTLPTFLSTEVTKQQSSNMPPVSSFVSTSWPQNSILSTEETATTKSFVSNYMRNRNFSKRLNFTSSKEPNKIANTDQSGADQVIRPITRKFHYTTPKAKPVWMAPRRNITRNYQRTTFPTTIYSEHFNAKDKYTTTTKPKDPPTRTVLTTLPSDIDPVLQSEIGGVKKVVHSPSISDNSIPTLWKRGSTKFASSTVTSAEIDDSSDLEIPPTLAWALASLRSPPSAAPGNRSVSTQKSVDENELQKVGEVTEKKDATTMAHSESVLTTSTIPKETTIPEEEENKLAWRPIDSSPTPTPPTPESDETTTELKVERLPAESNISEQNSRDRHTTEAAQTGRPYIDVSAAELIGLTNPPPWVAVSTNNFDIKLGPTPQKNNTVTSANGTKSSFESITKLPSGVTTPEADTIIRQTPTKIEEDFPEHNTAQPTTTDYEITTRRFNYVPTTTEEVEYTETDVTTADAWHPVVPTRTKYTSREPSDLSITTYRPKYQTTTEFVDETTTDSLMNVVELQEHKTTVKPVELTTQVLEEKTTVTFETTEQTTLQSREETSTVIVEVSTEISSERETKGSQFTTRSSSESTEIPTELPSSQSDSISEENSGSNEVITQDTPKPTPPITTTLEPTTKSEPSEADTTTAIDFTTQQEMKETTTVQESKEDLTTMKEDLIESTTEYLSTKSVNDLEDLSSYNGEVTTETSSRVLTTEEAGSGAAVAIAVSTIGVIALILLVGLLLVVRRRGRRGVYAQRCTPVSLDAYSLDSVSVGHRKGNHRLRASKRSYGNPAYDDEVTSHPMQYAALANFALDIDSMTAEFTEIPWVNVRADEVPPGCEDKNRYSNVLPLPATRVPLQRQGSDPTSEYINANYVTGPGNIKNYYIACQAPLQNTVADMWRMMWEQNSRLIIMLTEYMENGVEKCYEYLPPSEISDNKRTFGDFQVILKKREQRDKYAISSVQLINLKTRTWREITHMWYFWPAKGVPEDYDSIIDFLSEMRGYMKMSQTAKEYDEEGIEMIYGDGSRSSFNNLSKLRSEDGAGSNGHGVSVYSPQKAEELQRRANAVNGTLGRMKAASEVEGVRPCVVVCASGAARSAALIALDMSARALAAGAADVPRVVRELRAQRPHSLANRHHYIFIYKVLSEYGNKLMGGGVDTI